MTENLQADVLKLGVKDQDDGVDESSDDTGSAGSKNEYQAVDIKAAVH